MNRVVIATALALSLAASGTALAAGQSQEAQTSTGGAVQTETKNPMYEMRADEIIGQTVVNAQGEEIGTVEDLVIDPNDKVVYAIISAGGFLGMGDKKVAVEFDDLLMQEDQIQLSAQAAGELKDLPGYEEGSFESLPADQPVQKQDRQ